MKVSTGNYLRIQTSLAS